MGIYIGIGNYVGKCKTSNGRQPVEPNFYLITEENVTIVTQNNEYILMEVIPETFSIKVNQTNSNLWQQE